MTSLRDKLHAVYQKKVGGAMVDNLRTLALDTSAGVVLSTPVDTGRARANWNVSVNRIDASTTDSTAAPDILSEVAKVTAGLKANDVFYLSNNLAYIVRLNEGYSKQASASFVEKAVMSAKSRAKRRGRA